MLYEEEMKNIDAILIGDMHIREDQPECWVDDYWEAQAETIDFISDVQQKYDCPVLVPGDIFDKWNPSHELVSWAINNLPKKMIAIPGQHDLQQHRLDAFKRTALNVLWQSRKINMPTFDGKNSYITPILKKGGNHNSQIGTIYGFSWGAKLKGKSSRKGKPDSTWKVALCHTMTWINKKPFPGCEADSAHKLLEKMYGYDLVLVGDNHQSFVILHKGRLLVNPGSMMRMTAAQYNYKPRIFLWSAYENEVEPIYLPIKKNAITREHIDSKEERDERIDAFVSRLNNKGIEIGLSFEKNLKEFMSKEKTSEAVKEIVWEVTE